MGVAASGMGAEPVEELPVVDAMSEVPVGRVALPVEPGRRVDDPVEPVEPVSAVGVAVSVGVVPGAGVVPAAGTVPAVSLAAGTVPAVSPGVGVGVAAGCVTTWTAGDA